jgi:hypothetical protein
MEKNHCFEVGEGGGFQNIVFFQLFHAADSQRRLQ